MLIDRYRKYISCRFWGLVSWTYLVAQMVKNLPAMQETQV